MLDITSLTSLVDALRAETAKDSISPESLGSILQKILDLLATAAPESDVAELQVWRSFFNKPKSVVSALTLDTSDKGSVTLLISKDSLGLGISSQSSLALPEATTEQAGVMTADHVATLNATTEQAADAANSCISLTKRITQEIAARNGMFNQLTEKITDEATAREDTDTTLNAAISNETTERQQADKNLEISVSKRLTQLTNEQGGMFNKLTDMISDEATDREAADTTLTADISNETTERTEADTALQEKITEINQKIGSADGIAPLNSNKEIDNQYIPDDFDQVIKLVCVGTPVTVPSSGLDYYYNPDEKKLYRGVFHAGNDGKGYKWEETEIADAKIYIDRTTNIAYHLYDGGLEPLETPAEGYNTSATGEYAHAEGMNTVASGAATHAEGDGAQASGKNAHAEGSSTTASGDFTHAEGQNSTASGYVAHAEGANNTASGNVSHAEGQGTTASGQFSHSEGQGTSATKYAAHAEGGGCWATADCSHAEGQASYATGFCAHAEGLYTYAEGYASHAEGCFNVPSTLAIHCVGVGIAPFGDGVRRNAEEIIRITSSEKNGYKYLIGLGNYDGTNLQTTDDSGNAVLNPDILSVQEIISDLLTRVAALESKLS